MLIDYPFPFQFRGKWGEDYTTIKELVNEATKNVFEMEKEPVEKSTKLIDHSQEFCRNMRTYVLNAGENLFYDFTIMSIEGKEVKAHKILLASQSEYFAALFRKENPQMVSLNFGHEVISSCIKYIYNLEVNITGDNVQDILEFSNYIILVGVVDECSN